MHNLIQQGDSVQAYVNKYIADYRDDIAKLPTSCAGGSTCFVIEDSSKWVLSQSTKKWTELPKAGQGECLDDITYMTNADVDDMFAGE